MRLVRSLAMAALGLSSAGVACAIGCGSTTTGTGGDGGTTADSKTGGGDSSQTDSGPGITYPQPPSGPKTTSSTPQNFAIHQLFLGDTDYNGTADPMAYNGFGYNIDGKITTSASTNVCKLVDGGGSFGPAAQQDGNGGIDNSFGANIFTGVILMVDQTASTTINSAISDGTFTLMFDITGLTSSATQTATGLSAQAFAGGATTSAPTWMPSFNWPILGGTGLLKNDTPPFQSDIQFPDSYVVNGTWVSGTPVTISLSLSLDGISLSIPINEAVITFVHSTATHGGNGVISGVIPTATLVTGIKNLAGHLSASLCSGSALTGILAEITDASDIMATPDSTGSLNPGPSVTCNAISIGLGFTADEIGQPMDISPPVCGKADPCGDGGAPACDAGMPPDSGSGDAPSGG
jgi:hypothetical protein